MNSAIAVFVKTPSFSPIKTRLAQSIGPEKALEFYHLSVNAVTATLLELHVNDPSWTSLYAVAESEALNHWNAFSTLPQGEGELGDRLGFVFESLKSTYAGVFVIGADSPQLTSMDINSAREALCTSDCVVIPAFDGGFALFGAKAKIPNHIWKNIAYSTSQTCRQLCANLSVHFTVKVLPPKIDVDTAIDLEILRRELKNLSQINAAQKILMNWLEQQRD